MMKPGLTSDLMKIHSCAELMGFITKLDYVKY